MKKAGKMNLILLLITIAAIGLAVYAFTHQRRVPWHYDERIEYLEKVNGSLNTQIKQLALEIEDYQKQANFYRERAEVSLRNESYYKQKYQDEKNKIQSLNADDAIKFFGEWTKPNSN